MDGAKNRKEEDNDMKNPIPRILLVEDDLYYRTILARLLSQAKLAVDEAGDGKSALQKLEQE